MEPSPERSIVLSVTLEQDSQVVKILEVLGRAMAGLLLDGIEAKIYAYEYEEEQ